MIAASHSPSHQFISYKDFIHWRPMSHQTPRITFCLNLLVEFFEGSDRSWSLSIPQKRRCTRIGMWVLHVSGRSRKQQKLEKNAFRSILEMPTSGPVFICVFFQRWIKVFQIVETECITHFCSLARPQRFTPHFGEKYSWPSVRIPWLHESNKGQELLTFHWKTWLVNGDPYTGPWFIIIPKKP